MTFADLEDVKRVGEELIVFVIGRVLERRGEELKALEEAIGFINADKQLRQPGRHPVVGEGLTGEAGGEPPDDRAAPPEAVVGAIVSSDFPTAQGAIMILAIAFLSINLLVDVLYVYLDPRIQRR